MSIMILEGGGAREIEKGLVSGLLSLRLDHRFTLIMYKLDVRTSTTTLNDKASLVAKLRPRCAGSRSELFLLVHCTALLF